MVLITSLANHGKANLKPVIALMGRLATRMNRLDKKMDFIHKETAQEFKKSRKANDSFRKETAEQFKASRKEMKQEIQNVRKEMAKYYFDARDENRIIADEHARTLTKTYSTMDAMAKDYSRWLIEKQYNDVKLERHSLAIKELFEKDTEKDVRLQDLQKRVVALERAKNGRPSSPQSETTLKK